MTTDQRLAEAFDGDLIAQSIAGILYDRGIGVDLERIIEGVSAYYDYDPIGRIVDDLERQILDDNQ
jgi:hypothetical protein